MKGWTDVKDAALLFKDPSQPVEKRVDDLMSRLTIEEKAILLNHKGSTIERFNIKSDNWNQCLNGVRWTEPTTLFPTCIAMSATWDTTLVQEAASAISDEARAIYNGWHIDPNSHEEQSGLIYRAPVINIGRNPYWGRNHEAWGEDPFLTGRMGVSYVKGLQGDDPNHLKIGATLKHYAVNNVETDRTTLNAKVSETMLRDYYLSHFRDAIVEGKAVSVMASYNSINGVHNTMNPWLLTEVLKKDWGHQGFVVSDLGGIKQVVRQNGVSKEEVVGQSLMAGCDFSDKEFELAIPAAVQQGKLSMERLDDALRRVLTVRMKLGDFDPFESGPYSKIPLSVIDSPAHRALALKTAQESIVLLTNKGILPLDKTKLKKIAVIGPLADAVLLNNYNGVPAKTFTALHGIMDRVGPGTQVVTAPGCNVIENPVKKTVERLAKRAKLSSPPSIDAEKGIPAAVAIARDCDAVILCIGTDADVEIESVDRQTLGLTGEQEKLVKAVLAANPKTIIVEMSAGPLTVPWLKENAPAVLQAWWGGEEAGHALADVIFGDINPAGRLPHTVYASESQVPPLDEYDISKGFTYMYVKGEPLFPFGHGLSYTTFEYSGLKVSGTNPLSVTATIKNTGSRAGDEVAQLYLVPPKSDQPRPRLMLRGFQRVSLKPGETKQISFTVPEEKLTFWNETAKKFEVPQGHWGIRVGASSEDIRLSNDKVGAAKVKAGAAEVNDPWHPKTGTVQKVDVEAKRIVVKVGRELTFTVTDDTKIEQAGKPANLSDIKVNATVYVEYAKGDGDLRTAKKIVVKDK